MESCTTGCASCSLCLICICSLLLPMVTKGGTYSTTVCAARIADGSSDQLRQSHPMWPSSGVVCDKCQQQRRSSMSSSLAPEQQLLCSASSERLLDSCTVGCASCPLCLIVFCSLSTFGLLPAWRVSVRHMEGSVLAPGSLHGPERRHVCRHCSSPFL